MNKPIRILQVIGVMNYGGAETLLMDLYRHIDRNKVQFDFFVYNYSQEKGVYDDEIIALGGRIYYGRKRLYREPIAYRREIKDFCRLHKEYKVVHSHLNMRGGYVLQVYKNYMNCVTIAHSHTAYPKLGVKNRIVNWLGKYLLNSSADYFIGCSEDALVAICGHNSDNSKFIVMHNAIEKEKFKYSNDIRIRIRNQIGVGKNTFLIINVARFTAEKNHQFQIDIFKRLLKTRPDSMLIFIGDGPLKPKMEKYAKDVLGGDIEKLMFLGKRSNVNEFLSASDLFLFPSKGEGLGIVLIEAQANGLPCVISKDVIPDEADLHSGLVKRVSLKSHVGEWADACMSVLDERLNAVCAQRSISEAGYDIKKVARWLEEFYLKQCLH